MVADPQVSISEITETRDTSAFLGDDIPPLFDAFIVSPAWGALAGTIALLVPIIALNPESPQATVQTIMGGFLFVGLAASIFGLAGMIAIGLPTTLVLKLLRLEYRAIYSVIGAVAGFAGMAILFEIWRRLSPEVLMLPIAGGVAGAVCAFRWGTYREQLGKHHATPEEEPRHPTNPYHEMIF